MPSECSISYWQRSAEDVIHVRRSTSRGFTQVANGVLRDPRLSLKARGLLVQLLSHEDGWQQSVAYCARECRDGRDSIKAAFRELEQAGYAQRRRRKGPGGKWLWDITVSDERILVDSPSTVSPSMENPSTEKASIDEYSLGEEPLGEEPKELTLAPATRARDELFEALAEIDGTDLEDLTKTQRGRLNKATKELRDLDVPAEEVRHRAEQWTRRFPGATLTALALVAHWGELNSARQRKSTLHQQIELEEAYGG